MCCLFLMWLSSATCGVSVVHTHTLSLYYLLSPRMSPLLSSFSYFYFSLYPSLYPALSIFSLLFSTPPAPSVFRSPSYPHPHLSVSIQQTAPAVTLAPGQEMLPSFGESETDPTNSTPATTLPLANGGGFGEEEDDW